MIPAPQALERLRQGNRRFVTDDSPPSMSTEQGARDTLVAGQAPFAVILGCADSRASAELIFDSGLGELFVVRVAGNVVSPPLTGSIEYAVDQLGTRLIVVLGHSGCGAVGATLGQIANPSPGLSPGLRSIVDRIRPAVGTLTDGSAVGSELLDQAVRANVQASVARLRQESELLDRLAESGELWIVGAEYSLSTGQVEFFDGLPAGP